MAETTTVISLICERAADVSSVCDAKGAVNEVPGLHVIKLPCSGMIQPLMIEQAMKSGAQGVIVTGCQLGDCYYREGNKMIRERLLGERPPGLKKTVDRRRVMALWLSRVQTKQFLSEAKEFIARVKTLPALEAAKPTAQAVAGSLSGKDAVKNATTAQAKAEATEEKIQPQAKAVEPKKDIASVADNEKIAKTDAVAGVEAGKALSASSSAELADPKDSKRSEPN